MKKRRRRIIFIVLIALLAAIGIAHHFISRNIANRLATSLRQKLNADVQFRHAWYVPPYGLELRGVRLSIDGDEIVSIARLAVRLERVPAPHQPILIERLDIRDPIVRIHGAPPTTKPKAPRPPPQKLSSLFHLRRLRIDGGQVEGGGETPMIWRNIGVNIDMTPESVAKYTFDLHAQDGAAMQLASRGTIDVDELALAVTSLDLKARNDSDHPPQSLPPAVQQALRTSGMSGEIAIALAGNVSRAGWTMTDLHGAADFRNAGRIDFSGTASAANDWNDKPWWEAVKHGITLAAHDFSFQPRGFPIRVEHLNGEAAHLTGGVVQFRNLTAVYGTDHLELRAARLALKELPEKIAYREIDATVTFAAGTQYPPKLAKVIESLGPAGPFVIGGDWVRVRADREHPQYAMLVSSDTGTLNLAHGKLPLTKVRGDARVETGRVEVKQGSADLWGGSVTVSGVCNFGANKSYRGRAILRDIDVKNLAPANSKSRGRGFATADFAGKGPSLKDFHATGEAEITDGEFFELPVLREIFGKIKPAREAVTAGEAGALFEINSGVVRLRRAAINAPMLGLQGGGEVGFDGNVNLEVVAAPLADWRNKLKQTKIPLISDVAGEIVGGVQRMLNAATGTLLYQFRVDGSLKDPHIAPVPVPILSDAGALLFGRMLQEKKPDSRLVDFLKAQE